MEEVVEHGKLEGTVIFAHRQLWRLCDTSQKTALCEGMIGRAARFYELSYRSPSNSVAYDCCLGEGDKLGCCIRDLH